MKCPACKSNLSAVKSHSIEFHKCPECRGMWFQNQQFQKLVHAVSEDEKVQSSDYINYKPREVKKAHDQSEHMRICPECNCVMKEFNYAYDSNILLDKCNNCGSIWADRGETLLAAQHLKTNPKIDAIGASIANDSKSKIETRRMKQDMNYLGSYLAIGGLSMPIPLSDNTKREKVPWVTISIIAICTVIFILQTVFVDDYKSYLNIFAWAPAQYLSLGLLTSMFLHGGLMHLLGNMLFLWIFGDNIEDKFSKVKFILFYLACGISADLLHLAFNFGDTTPSLGASGAISGIMGAYLIFHPEARLKTLILFRIVEVPAALYIGAWFILQLYYSVVYSLVGYSHVAWFAHIGGFVFGAAFAFFYKRHKKQAVEIKK